VAIEPDNFSVRGKGCFCFRICQERSRQP
jgi:hypothetical protein